MFPATQLSREIANSLLGPWVFLYFSLFSLYSHLILDHPLSPALPQSVCPVTPTSRYHSGILGMLPTSHFIFTGSLPDFFPKPVVDHLFCIHSNSPPIPFSMSCFFLSTEILRQHMRPDRIV